MIKPLIDTMSVQPSGGHSVFSQQELNTMSSVSQKVEQAPVPSVHQGKSQQETVPEATAGNSLPGSANSSRSDTSNFDPSSEEETDMYEPYVYTEVSTFVYHTEFKIIVNSKYVTAKNVT